MRHHTITRPFSLMLTGTFSASFTTTPYDPGNVCGPPENCYPPEGGEVEDLEITAESVTLADEDGEPIAVTLSEATSTALLAAMSRVLAEIDDADGKVMDYIADQGIGSDHDDPDPDEWNDRERDRRLMRD